MGAGPPLRPQLLAALKPRRRRPQPSTASRKPQRPQRVAARGPARLLPRHPAGPTKPICRARAQRDAQAQLCHRAFCQARVVRRSHRARWPAFKRPCASNAALKSLRAVCGGSTTLALGCPQLLGGGAALQPRSPRLHHVWPHARTPWRCCLHAVQPYVKTRKRGKSGIVLLHGLVVG
jgi:hypothetical protein